MSTMTPVEQEPHQVTAAELRDILTAHRTFAGLSAATLEALAAVMERVFVPAGHEVAAAKAGRRAESAYVVEHGRLRLTGSEGGRRLALEVGRGELCLLGAILAEAPADVELVALRDSVLLRVGRADLLRCLRTHEDMIVAYTRHAQDTAVRIAGWGGTRNRPHIFAVLPASADPGNREAAAALLEAFTEAGGSGTLVDSARLSDLLGETPTTAEQFERVRRRLSRWCGEQEAAGRFVLCFCDPDDTPWTRWCLEQTDRIAVVARAGATSELERIDRIFRGRTVAGEPLRVDLLLRHEADAGLPRGTAAWMRLACCRRHHHLRRGNMADFRRAMRRMSERAVGVALGGGGARGVAHLGVLRALEEAGVPIDVIGGTSMGAVMAATYARGWSPQHTLDVISQLLPAASAIADPDFPLVSLLAGRKLDGVLQATFEDYDISDLWIPFYCITANLSEARMMVHDRGPVWENVRASCSLPGIFPPVHQDGHLLVDGGVVNNVPVDIMQRECAGGTVIAVDVGGGGAKLQVGKGAVRSGWRLLGNRLNPLAPNEPIASIMQVLSWSTTLSSKQYIQQLVRSGLVDLFLTPPVHEFQLLSFDQYQRLYEVGYEDTRERLAAWDGLAALPSSTPRRSAADTLL